MIFTLSDDLNPLTKWRCAVGPTHPPAMTEFAAVPRHFLAEYQQPTAGNRALFESCRSGHVDEVRRLLKHGACMNWYNEAEGGLTAAHVAVESGSLETLKAVAEFRADDPAHAFLVNISTTTNKARPLHIASAKGNVAMVRYLLSLPGIQIDAPNAYGSTPLMLASVDSHLEVAQVLLEAGANTKAGNSTRKETALHVAIAGIVRRSRVTTRGTSGFDDDRGEIVDLRIVMMLLKHGVDVNFADADGSTPLHLLCTVRENDTVVSLGHLLIKHGADTKLRDINGQRPADILRNRGGGREFLKLLTQHELLDA